jgi:hypothetical protein
MRAEPATDHAERHTMAVTTWVVVADGSRARFFETPGLKLHLREIEDLVDIVPSGPALSEKDRENSRRPSPTASNRDGFISGISDCDLPWSRSFSGCCASV